MPGADLAFDGAQLAQVRGQLVGLGRAAGGPARAAPRPARFAGPRPRRPSISRSSASSSSRSAWRSAASRDIALLGDDQRPADWARGGPAPSSTADADRRQRRRSGEAGLEQARHGPQGGQRVAALAADESIGLDRLVEWAVVRDVERRVVGRRRGGCREADGELERAGRPGRPGGPRRRRPGPSRRATVGRGRRRPAARARPMIGMAAPMTGAASSGTNRASVHSSGLGDDDASQGDPGAADHAPEPQAPAMRRERGPQRIDRRVQLAGEMLARIRRDHGGADRSGWRPDGSAGCGTGGSFGGPRTDLRGPGGGASDGSGRRPGRRGAGRWPTGSARSRHSWATGSRVARRTAGPGPDRSHRWRPRPRPPRRPRRP